MPARIEFYNGTEWLSGLVSLVGTGNQITVAQDPTTKVYAVSIASNPVLPGDTTIDSTGYLKLPVGTTAERPETPEAGMIRFNTDATSS